MKKHSEISRGTPKVMVFRNDGLAVRQITYHRRNIGKIAEVRTQLQRYDSAGQLKSNIDPRLSVDYLKQSSSITPNQQQINTLNGSVLKTENVDAGTRIEFSDVNGLALWSWDSRGTERRMEHDALRRMIALHEKESGKEFLCRERWRYGDVLDASGRANCVGQLIDHFNTAGRHSVSGYSLLGSAQQETCTFLTEEDKIDWKEDEKTNQTYLEEQSYTSRCETNALGSLMRQIDAAENERNTQVDMLGQVSLQSVKLKNENEQVLVKNRFYNANGQLLEETLGNGVQLQYHYEAETRRLQKKIAIRFSDNTVLQSLQYTYDPVGNILIIEDKAAETSYYKNTKAESIYHYIYDSLYQLIQADGIESDLAGRETSRLPGVISFGSKDPSRLVNYQRHYHYDSGGNLYEIQHQGATRYTQKLTIDTASNRGIGKRESGPSLHESFDANGNLLYLNIGQSLSWNTRNQLQLTTQIERDNALSDQESYLYGRQSMRVQKTRQFLAENQIHTERVRYLPGLELREHWQTDLQGQNKIINETLHCLQGIELAVKILHWESGKPNVNAVENNAIYYSLTDQIGSHLSELNQAGEMVNIEAYYPYGGTAIWSTKNQIESSYKYHRYSDKERDHSGLYYYGYRYYLPWLGRWLNPDPIGDIDELNCFCFVRNSPVTMRDPTGAWPHSTAYGPFIREIITSDLPYSLELKTDGEGAYVYDSYLRNEHEGAHRSYLRSDLEERLQRIDKTSLSDKTPEFVLKHQIDPRRKNNSGGIATKVIKVVPEEQPQLEVGLFESVFTAETWVLSAMSREKEAGTAFFANNIRERQYDIVSKKGGFYGKIPSGIVIPNVINEETLTKTENIANGSSEIMRIFLDQTPIGKSIVKTMENFGFHAIEVERHEVQYKHFSRQMGIWYDRKRTDFYIRTELD